MKTNCTSTFRSVLITGASSGIGRDLALACSAPGVVVHLCARDPERLERAVQACRAAGADARPGAGCAGRARHGRVDRRGWAP